MSSPPQRQARSCDKAKHRDSMRSSRHCCPIEALLTRKTSTQRTMPSPEGSPPAACTAAWQGQHEITSRPTSPTMFKAQKKTNRLQDSISSMLSESLRYKTCLTHLQGTLILHSAFTIFHRLAQGPVQVLAHNGHAVTRGLLSPPLVSKLLLQLREPLPPNQLNDMTKHCLAVSFRVFWALS